MEEYGIDGVFVQRFVNELQNCDPERPGSCGPRDFKDAVLTHALQNAEKRNRVVTLMYDISGASEEKWVATILADWRHLINDLKVLQSKAWLHHEDKPVLSVWGIGFTAHPGTPQVRKTPSWPRTWANFSLF